MSIVLDQKEEINEPYRLFIRRPGKHQRQYVMLHYLNKISARRNESIHDGGIL